MGRLTALLLALGCSGCAVVTPVATTVAAIPGFLVEGIFNQTQGAEESYPITMRTALATTQQGLRETKLDVDLLEPAEDGYVMLFSNDKLDGQVTLRQQTSRLTTFYVSVRHGMGREQSVERAILEVFHKRSETLSGKERFDFKGYEKLWSKPSQGSKEMGWYRPGARLDVKKTHEKGWLMIRLPSKRTAYLQGEVPSEKHANK